MISKKTLDYGFNGYGVPVIPRAPRSIRRKTPQKNPVEDSNLCAFELLAAVAGKLLEESESSASSNVAGGNDNLVTPGDRNEKGNSVYYKSSNFESFDGGSCILDHTTDVLKKVDAEKCQIFELSTPETSKLLKANEEYVNSSNMLIHSDSSVQLPLYREPDADALLQKHSTDVNVGIRDDDENSYRGKKSSTNVCPFKPQPRPEHRRIRKIMTSKYRKIAPKRKGYELYNTSVGMNSLYQYRKRVYTRDRCQQAPMKKRRLSDQRFSTAYDRDMGRNSISYLPEKGCKTANGTVKVHQKSNDPHVKFSIKSFKVPELYVEVPETASVGSLKRTVMEAVTAILGSGIRVGVVLQGKKVRDDNRTLQQAGISESSNLDTLNFTLEPCFARVSPSITAKKTSSVLPCEENQELPRSPATLVIDSGISTLSVDTLVTKFDDNDDVDNKNGLLSSPQTPRKELIDGESVPDSKNALVQMNVGSLAMVQMNPKSKRSELSQRRTRRPFSVTEVDALVGAVEKLGTGRWRDVKIGAFENADHRTYVDLKDKWKTLVHTASISPQQRRGEPVPQELLDRVLSAHSYWSQHQSKQHGKYSVETLKAAGDEEIVGA